MKLIKLLSVLSMLGLFGCAGAPLIAPVTNHTLAAPPENKAQIIFVNPSNSIAAAFLSGVYEIKDGKREFFGMLGSKNKIAIDVEPGLHMFMAHTGISHLLSANVEAGKRYYVILRFLYGRGQQLRPIRKDNSSEFSVVNPKFSGWIKDATFVNLTPAGNAWYTKYQSAVDEAQTAALAEWQAKSSEQKAELTLNPSDAVNL